MSLSRGVFVPSGFFPLLGRTRSYSKSESASADSSSSEESSEQGEFAKDSFDNRRFERQMSVIQIRRPPSTQTEFSVQVEAQIKPKNSIHLALLQGCTDLKLVSKEGSVSISLTREFLTWVCGLEPQLVEQAYTDAVYLSGKGSPSLSDCMGLYKQAGLERRWREDDVISMQWIRINSQRLLLEYGSLREKNIKITRRDMKDLNEDYSASTGGGKLDEDYQYSKRAFRFRQQLNDLHNKLESQKKLAQAIAEMEHSVPTGKTELVLAIKRLLMRFEQRTEMSAAATAAAK